ncbi:hypothetical protein AHMF7605_06795 [Adhaeribacter arboris]|uniref:Uncharacterized protein n=1 Tax=Adhaeribacter arboris TaxID=2072846 RepID=A0A2T2YCL6_9BACT|nr:hypothetical protein [Adhaeribacter arboris]PSR53257.1 hypothetical protein AHMF7605_06795 [Adhaeribacter arboris]
MRLFEKFTKDQINRLKRDTSNFFLGSPEAEAESTSNSRVKLTEVFEDFFEVIPQLQSEKFIITGRKGNGKSAIAEHIYYLALNEPEYFCDFVKKADIDIEKITQLVSGTDNEISQELLIEWIILVKFVKQLISNEAIADQKGIKELKVFLKKNSGFIDIKSNQIKEVIQDKGWEVNVNYFQRFLTAKFGNRFNIKGEKAPFFKLLPHLKETIKELFLNTINKDNHYILLFDDLDIGFNAKNPGNVKTILNILRIVKDYNITFFGKEDISAKIILLLRDDISRFLLNQDADTAKLFSSYEVTLKWYEHFQMQRDEDKVKLKQFINRRIALNFEKNEFSFDISKPWESLIHEDESYKKSSFKYIVEHTLIRPRDLILFFKPLQELKFSIPLSKQDVYILIGKYTIEFVKELKNELAAHYAPDDINAIFSAFVSCANEPVSFIFFIHELKKFHFSEDTYNLLELLFDLSIIGNTNDTGKTYFKHWEKDDEIFKFNKELKITQHFTLRNYCQRNRRN